MVVPVVVALRDRVVHARLHSRPRPEAGRHIGKQLRRRRHVIVDGDPPLRARQIHSHLPPVHRQRGLVGAIVIPRDDAAVDDVLDVLERPRVGGNIGEGRLARILRNSRVPTGKRAGDVHRHLVASHRQSGPVVGLRVPGDDPGIEARFHVVVGPVPDPDVVEVVDLAGKGAHLVESQGDEAMWGKQCSDFFRDGRHRCSSVIDDRERGRRACGHGRQDVVGDGGCAGGRGPALPEDGGKERNVIPAEEEVPGVEIAYCLDPGRREEWVPDRRAHVIVEDGRGGEVTRGMAFPEEGAPVMLVWQQAETYRGCPDEVIVDGGAAVEVVEEHGELADQGSGHRPAHGHPAAGRAEPVAVEEPCQAFRSIPVDEDERDVVLLWAEIQLLGREPDRLLQCPGRSRRHVPVEAEVRHAHTVEGIVPPLGGVGGEVNFSVPPHQLARPRGVRDNGICQRLLVGVVVAIEGEIEDEGALGHRVVERDDVTRVPPGKVVPHNVRQLLAALLQVALDRPFVGCHLVGQAAAKVEVIGPPASELRQIRDQAWGHRETVFHTRNRHRNPPGGHQLIGIIDDQARDVRPEVGPPQQRSQVHHRFVLVSPLFVHRQPHLVPLVPELPGISMTPWVESPRVHEEPRPIPVHDSLKCQHCQRVAVRHRAQIPAEVDKVDLCVSCWTRRDDSAEQDPHQQPAGRPAARADAAQP